MKDIAETVSFRGAEEPDSKKLLCEAGNERVCTPVCNKSPALSNHTRRAGEFRAGLFSRLIMIS